MTPLNAIYSKVFEVCNKNGRTFDYLPDGDAEYPFIFLGNIRVEDEKNSDLIGQANLRLDAYGLRTHRNALDIIQMSLNNDFMRLDEAFNYNIRVTRLNTEIRPENMDRQPLLRMMMELEIEYIKKER